LSQPPKFGCQYLWRHRATTPKAAKRLLAFFTAQINNNHNRTAYL